VHTSFVGLVKERRGAKIEAAGEMLFTGEFWSGKRSYELGLVDGLSDLRTRMREIFGPETRFRMVPTRGGFFRRKPAVSAGETPGASCALPAGVGGGIAEGLADGIISSLETRALWSKFGF
jgi:serine protease SohB